MKTYGQIVKILVTICVYVCILLPLPHSSYGETNLKIWHDPPACAVVGSPIRISADIVSTTPPKEVRIYFKEQGTTPFYFVQMKQEKGNTYAGIIPAPMKTAKLIEYFILAVDGDENILRAPLSYILITTASECPESPMSSEQEKERSNFPKQRFDKKTAIGLGIGLVTLAVIGIVVSGEEESGVDWTISVDDPADDVVAELYKVPETQTSCGTVVTNQLYVTNNRAESLTIGTIDYEVVLTRDKPAGSCEGGRIGTFAPNWATVVHPGETVLIREWSNEVNPCGNCPYLIAKCRWDSQYIIHTSAGSVIAESTFTVEGDLCATPSAKSFDGGAPVKGDTEP